MMSKKDPSRTEKATQKKINQTRDDGKVLTSPDLTSLGVLLGGVMLLIVTFPMLLDAFHNMFRSYRTMDFKGVWTEETIISGCWVGLSNLGVLTLPFMISSCVIAIITLRLQIGSYFSIKALQWKLEGMNPISGLQRFMPSVSNFTRLGLTLGKIIIIGSCVYLVLRGDFQTIMELPLMPLSFTFDWIMKRIVVLVLKIMVVFVIIAILDYIHRRHEYYDNLMMTKEEVKDERKNAEGDPQVKARIRAKMNAFLRERMMTNVPSADVVITNPTHVAVALKYNPGKFAPEVVAKGLRKRALKIKQIARENDVPIVEAPPLARSLYRHTRVGSFIPPQLFGAVAAILARLQRQGRKIFVS